MAGKVGRLGWILNLLAVKPDLNYYSGKWAPIKTSVTYTKPTPATATPGCV